MCERVGPGRYVLRRATPPGGAADDESRVEEDVGAAGSRRLRAVDDGLDGTARRLFGILRDGREVDVGEGARGESS